MARTSLGSLIVGLLSLNLWVTASAGTLATQQELAQLSGIVVDETGGVMQAVTVRVFYLEGDHASYETSTDEAGVFRLDLPMGEYRLQVSASAFATVEQHVTVTDRFEPLTVTMRLDVVTEVVDVAVNPAEELRLNSIVSLTALTLSEDELLALPTDEEELVEYLMILAGADPSGDLEDNISTFIIDGFDQGRLPDPDEIAQIIIDPVPISLDGGEGPRIEIITRPGTGRWGGSSRFTFADESLDATTPGESAKPSRQTRDVDFDLSGPLVADLIDIDVEASTRSQERAVNSLRAITPTDNFFEAVVRPETEHSVELDADVSLSPSRTLGVDFDYETELTENSGVGGFTLPERGADETRDEWTFQISERRLGSNSTNHLRGCAPARTQTASCRCPAAWRWMCPMPSTEEVGPNVTETRRRVSKWKIDFGGNAASGASTQVSKGGTNNRTASMRTTSTGHSILPVSTITATPPASRDRTAPSRSRLWPTHSRLVQSHYKRTPEASQLLSPVYPPRSRKHQATQS